MSSHIDLDCVSLQSLLSSALSNRVRSLNVTVDPKESRLRFALGGIDPRHHLLRPFDANVALRCALIEGTQRLRIQLEWKTLPFLLRMFIPLMPRNKWESQGLQIISKDEMILDLERIPVEKLPAPLASFLRTIAIEHIVAPGSGDYAFSATFHLKE